MDDHAELEVECNRKRNLDRRRETSRYAARDRRGKEADIFTDLKEVVPIVEEATVTHVDRIALLRVASTLCRLRKNAGKLLRTTLCGESVRLWSETTVLESLDGFLAIIDSDGIILYVTESVSIYLGLTQTDLTGRSLKEFVHQSDYEDFTTIGSCKSDETEGHMMSMRMKSVISPRGRNLNLKSALFKPVICRIRSVSCDGGHVRILQGSTEPAGQGNNLAATSKNAEIPNGTYMTRHTCDMKFSYVSENFNYMLRREARSLMGTSFYDLVHPADIDSVAESIREMLVKGHSRTPYYRLIGSNGLVIWVQTEARTVNHTSKGQKSQYVICIHDLLGTQSEAESFKSYEFADSVPMLNTDIKKEVDDGPEEGKSGYNDVLQWLFRNHPNSPAPASTSSTTPSNNIFRPIDGHKRPTVNSNSGSNSNNSSDNNNNSNSNNNNNNNSNRRSSNGPDDPDPPLARAALYAYRRDTPDSSADEVYENSSESPYTNNVGVGYSPLADGVAECDLRSSAGGSQSDSRGGGGGGTGGTESCVPSFAFGTDYASESMSSSLRVSTIPSADGYPLSNGENLSGESEQRVDDLYPGLSPASSRYGGGQMNGTYDNYANRNNRPQTMVCNGMCKTSREDLLDNPVIQMLAPFVSQEDVMQLTTDIHGLLPDFSELIPPDPSSLPLSPSESRDMCASSQSGTGMTSVVVSPISSSHDSSYSKRSSASSLMGSQCDGFPSNNVAPSQWLEQEYRMPTAVVSGVANGYTWTELGVRASDTVLPSFHRDAVPTFQQQRV